MARASAGVSRPNQARCLILLGFLFLIWSTQNIDLFPFLKSDLAGSPLITYVLRPLLWLSLALAIWFLPRTRPAGRLRLKTFLCTMAFICAGFYILCQIAGGWVDGFGKSPYSFTIMGIIVNFILVSSTLLGTELCRAFFVNRLAAGRPLLVVIMVSILFTLLSIPLGKLLALKSILEAVKFTGNNILPAFSENIFTSFLAYLGGPLPALIYQGTLQGFRWFCPVLPKLEWISRTLIGTFVPFFSLVIVQQMYLTEAREGKKRERNKESFLGWVVTSVVSVLIIWFAVGLFPVYPAVIVTGSMEPVIMPGDVVILKKINGNDVKPGDIVEFRHNNLNITHRVVAIKNEKERLYQTKGDNNPSVDAQLVSPRQVRGKVMAVIPKIGWPAIYLRSNGSTENVEI